MNKLDLVTSEELSDVEDRIKSMNSFAKIIKTEKSRAPLDQILGLNRYIILAYECLCMFIQNYYCNYSFSLEKMIEVDPTLMDEDETEHDHAGHVHDEHCGI